MVQTLGQTILDISYCLVQDYFLQNLSTRCKHASDEAGPPHLAGRMDLFKHPEVIGGVLSTLYYELVEKSLCTNWDLPHWMLLSYSTWEKSGDASAKTILISPVSSKFSHYNSIMLLGDIPIQLARS